MDKLAELKQQRAAIFDENEALLKTIEEEEREMTDEETKAFDERNAKIEEFAGKIERQEKHEETRRRLAATKPSGVRTSTEDPNREIPEKVVIPARCRARRELRGFTGPDAEENAYRSGRWLLASLFNHEPSQRFCNDHGIETRAQNEGVNTQGGFLVPVEFENSVINLREQYGAARNVCKIAQMSTDTLTVPRRTGGVTAYFPGEGSEITASDKDWDAVNLNAQKVGALVRMSNEVNEDAVISLVDDLADEMAHAFAKKEDECMIDGDGSATYGGMTGFRVKMIDGNHAASYVVASSGADTFAEIISGDMTQLIATIPQYAEANARWLMSKAAWGQVCLRLMLAGGGNNVADLAAGAEGQRQFQGYPVTLSEAMPAGIGTSYAGAIMLAFGNFSQAITFGDRRGVSLKLSEDRYLEYDQIALKATERFDIVVHDIGDGSNAGPIAGLNGTS